MVSQSMSEVLTQQDLIANITASNQLSSHDEKSLAKALDGLSIDSNSAPPNALTEAFKQFSIDAGNELSHALSQFSFVEDNFSNTSSISYNTRSIFSFPTKSTNNFPTKKSEILLIDVESKLPRDFNQVTSEEANSSVTSATKLNTPTMSIQPVYPLSLDFEIFFVNLFKTLSIDPDSELSSALSQVSLEERDMFMTNSRIY